jgi:ankyrin repeat protein
MKRAIATLFWTVLLSTAGFAAAAGDVADAAMKNNAETLRTLVQQKADVNAAQADGTTALHWAARWDDAAMADLLIKAGANAGAANREGATPMFLATMNGSAAMIETLLKGGADVNAPILPSDVTALMMAARTGKLDAVKALVDHGAKLEAIESLRGTTPLMWAAEQGHTDIVKFLIDKGANIHAQSKVFKPIRRGGLNLNARPGPDGQMTGDPMGGLTPLMFAVRQGSIETVKLLVGAGADIAKPAVDGSTPLLVAVQNGHYEIGKFLLERGANPNQANGKDWTPLYLAVSNRNALTTAVPAPSTDGALDFIKLLLDRGADPNHRIRVKAEVHQANTSLWLKEEGATPLLRAALCGDITAVRLLLGYGADPKIPTLDGTTPLMAASGVGWAEGFTFEYSPDQTLELVKLLLDAGANVNEGNEDGITPLHGAAYKGANKVVQLLVDRGADLAVKDKGKDYGFGVSSVRMTPLNWAEGVPIGMSSAIYHTDTVELMVKLMRERNLPVEYHSFDGKKRGDGELFPTPPPPPPSVQK